MATSDDSLDAGVRAGRGDQAEEVSPVEVIDAVLARIEQLNPRLNAFVTLTARSGAQGARAAERAVMQAGRQARPAPRRAVLGEGPRHHQGRAHHVRHAALPRQRPDRGRADGRAHEGRGRRSCSARPTRRPSAGSAPPTTSSSASRAIRGTSIARRAARAAAPARRSAAGLGPLAIGTDGGGSIRIPASCAGIFGIKPSYGRIPIYPFSAAWSLSHIGPHDPHGGRRRADDERVRGPRRARSVLAAGARAWTTSRRSRAA